jgi:hypothetical protein
LFNQNFFETPVTRDGKRIEFEQVVTELEQDTISYSMTGGARIGYNEGLVMQFQVEPNKYEAAIEWARKVRLLLTLSSPN